MDNYKIISEELAKIKYVPILYVHDILYINCNIEDNKILNEIFTYDNKKLIQTITFIYIKKNEKPDNIIDDSIIEQIEPVNLANIPNLKKIIIYQFCDIEFDRYIDNPKIDIFNSIEDDIIELPKFINIDKNIEILEQIINYENDDYYEQKLETSQYNNYKNFHYLYRFANLLTVKDNELIPNFENNSSLDRYFYYQNNTIYITKEKKYNFSPKIFKFYIHYYNLANCIHTINYNLCNLDKSDCILFTTCIKSNFKVINYTKHMTLYKSLNIEDDLDIENDLGIDKETFIW